MINTHGMSLQLNYYIAKCVISHFVSTHNPSLLLFVTCLQQLALDCRSVYWSVFLRNWQSVWNCCHYIIITLALARVASFPRLFISEKPTHQNVCQNILCRVGHSCYS